MEERTKRRLEETLYLVSPDLGLQLEGFYQKLVYERRASWHTVHASFSDLKLFFTFLKNYQGNLFTLKYF